ncbi:kinase-like protein [Pilatotrama ljubarskyi]|nr:kinase-like protein [Pilatotrama ljubarskyi]
MYNSSNIPDLVGHTIEHGRLRLVSTLGAGSNGVIFLAEDTMSGSSPPAQVAVKCVVRAEKGTRRHTLQRQEIHFHRALSAHPNVVTLHRVIEDKYYIFLVMDYCPGGDLFTFLSNRRDYRGDTEYIKRLYVQILNALEACHDAGIYHRDLKPENILISQDAQHVYLTDFGLATTNRFSKTYGAGSSLYMSPECIGSDPARRPYDTRANDIWALGVILTSMISGHNPWNHARPTDPCYRAYLRNDRFLINMLPISTTVNIVLQHIFCPEAIRRVTLENLRHTLESMDTYFMRPEVIASSCEYLRSSAKTYFEGSPLASYYLPAASTSSTLVLMEEGDAEGRRNARARDSPSSDMSDGGPNTPEMRAQQPELEVADLAEGPYAATSVELPGGPATKRRRSMSPAGILRRLVDRFFTESPS